MKIKSIIACGLLLLGVGAATTSCEDMLTADNNLVTTDLAPQDTVYQMMGIVQRMQKLADRTILLGEARADLVDVDPIHASADIQELANNSISTTNVYNSPTEYYSVINSCNIYLAYVDSLYQVYGDYYYRKEVIAAKCFRAWCYLELAKIYGEVPFVTEPVLDAETADMIVSSNTKKDIIGILDFAIQDLQPYAFLAENNGLRPSFGSSGYRDLFIPVRALLGELYLWRGSAKGKDAGQSDFIDAVRMYHDYFTFPGEEICTAYNACEWFASDFTMSNPLSTYTLANFTRLSGSYAAYMPLDTAAYFGNTTDLRAVFNSTYANNYYPALIPSTRMSDISKAQDYCFYYYNNFADNGSYYAPKDGSTLGSERLVGDLRLSNVYLNASNISESRYNANVNSTKQYITKWTGGNSRLSNDARQTWVYYYRTNILYLHMAEALNLAGFPETAFAVLTHGLTSSVLNSTEKSVTKSDGTSLYMRVVSEDEFDRLCNIKSYGFTNSTTDYDADETKAEKAANSFVVWKSTVFRNIPKSSQTRTSGSWSSYQSLYGNEYTSYLSQVGIHSLGSGDTEYNERYQLDDQATIDQLLQGYEPSVPLGYEEGQPALDYDTWKSRVTSGSTTAAAYALYQAAYAAYPTLLANYEADMTLLSSAAVRTARQERVRWLILEEEALEGSFEGNRFYDLLRYQMQDSKVSGVSATIQMPDSITKLYGATPNMTGKPWYLTMPER